MLNRGEIRVAIIGTGHVGLVTAAIFAERGFKVMALDHDKDKVDMINRGKAPYFEANLDEIVEKVVATGMLKAVLDREKAVKSSNICFIAVGTPSLPDGSADLRYVKAVAADIGEALKDKDEYTLVVARSTVVPGIQQGMLFCLSLKRILVKRLGEILVYV